MSGQRQAGQQHPSSHNPRKKQKGRQQATTNTPANKYNNNSYKVIHQESQPTHTSTKQKKSQSINVSAIARRVNVTILEV